MYDSFGYRLKYDVVIPFVKNHFYKEFNKQIG
jgi:hypothetical protein